MNSAVVFVSTVVFQLAINQVAALTCYNCLHVKPAGDGDVASFYPSDAVVPVQEQACEVAALTSIMTLNATGCEDGQICGAARLEITAPDGTTGTVTIRSCTNSPFGECARAADTLTVEGLDGGVTVQDSTFCTCDIDYCSALDCPGSYLRVFHYCLHYGIVAALAAAVLLLITGCCCCCCCCYCCKKKD